MTWARCTIDGARLGEVEMIRLAAAFCLSLVAAAAAAPAAADELVRVRVNTFPNAKALPFHAGLAKGLFARHGIELDLAFTENSKAQRDGLAAGRFAVAQAALDNAVAMIEVARQDVIIVGGGDGGVHDVFVQPDRTSFGGLRGP